MGFFKHTAKRVKLRVKIRVKADAQDQNTTKSGMNCAFAFIVKIAKMTIYHLIFRIWQCLPSLHPKPKIPLDL